MTFRPPIRLYGKVVRLPDIDPAHKVASVQDKREWRTPRRGPRSSQTEQVDRSFRGGLQTDRTAAWEPAWEDHWEWRRRVRKAPHPRAYVPNKFMFFR